MVGGVSDGLDVWMITSRRQFEHAQPQLPRDITMEHTTRSPEGVERNPEREYTSFEEMKTEHTARV